MSNPFQLIRGDCLDAMRQLPDSSIDSIVTDPPYGLGFMGKSWDHGVPGVPFWTEMLRVLKPGGHVLAFSGSRTYHRMASAIEDAGFEIRDQIMWVYGSGFPKSLDVSKAIDKAAGVVTDAARQWQGWGTALKPAHEPICVARKPLVGSVAANVLAHGTGALNIDGCRVNPTGESRGRMGEASQERRYTEAGGTNFSATPGVRGGDPAGRWPANLIHDGSDEVVGSFPQAPGQMADVSETAPSDKTGRVYGAMKRKGEPSQDSANEGSVGFKMKPGARRLDAGSAARFFYCAKASRADRNAGCEDMAKKALNWSSGTQNPGSFQSEGTDKSAQNFHPTVKPTDLMAYLCRLVTPPGGIVLDPFMGSGSTGKAAVREGFRFIGIDLDEDDLGLPIGYLDIAKARIAHEYRKRVVSVPADNSDLF